MQYLYVLTSTQNDNYYEQFLLSVTSLKQLMPSAEIALLCDSSTKDNLTGSRSHYKELISNLVCIETPANYKQIEVSRWLKTSMRTHIKGDFLFIDCDTIITDDLFSISDLKINFAACLDKHLPLNTHPKSKEIIKNDKLLNFSSCLSNKHFNSGILYCPDTKQTHKLFNRWHELWQFSRSKNIVRDQPSLNQAIYESIQENPANFTELNGIWNCQIAHNGLPYLANSKIIHYFATELFSGESPYLLSHDKILNKIKETGTLPDEALKLLVNPRAAFVSQTRIVSHDILDTVNSNFFEAILLTKRKFPKIFLLLNKLSSLLKPIVKKAIVNKSKNKDGGIKHYN